MALFGSRRRSWSTSGLVLVVDEVTSRTVRTETSGVVRATQIGLVLGMTDDFTQVVAAVRKLALVAVAARAVLGKRPTKFRLVPRARRRSRRTSAVIVQSAAQ